MCIRDRDKIGGVMRYGIPNYRLTDSVLDDFQYRHLELKGIKAVSYTHLDVYKRQPRGLPPQVSTALPPCRATGSWSSWQSRILRWACPTMRCTAAP